MHPLDGSFLKAGRAKEHFDIVHKMIKGLTKRKAYKLVSEVVGKGKTREYLVRFKQTEPLPINLPLIIGDGCSNLRAALDHLLWQLHLLHNPSFNRNVKFPIWDKESLFRTKASSDIRDLSDIQKAAIESLQPYRTKNTALSILRDVNDTDKHRLIQIVSLRGQVERMRVAFDQSRAMLTVPKPRTSVNLIPAGTEVKDDAIVARVSLNGVSQGTYMDVHYILNLDHAFTGGKLTKNHLITATLHNMLSEVNRVLTTLEPEFAHLGTSTFKG